jgi:hypothetical protein
VYFDGLAAWEQVIADQDSGAAEVLAEDVTCAESTLSGDDLAALMCGEDRSAHPGTGRLLASTPLRLP